MNNTDTSELLRLCDDVLYNEPKYDETIGEIKDICTLARALKSRLQAEAPTDAEVLREVMLALEDLSFECFSPIAPCNPPSVATYSRTFDVLDRHRKARGWATVPKTAISKPRTSQAEAQAPAVTRDRLLDMRHNSDHAFHEAATSSWDDFAIRFPDALQIACIHRRELIAALLPTTSSQAEAQAPTTAASVLTEDERAEFKSSVNEFSRLIMIARGAACKIRSEMTRAGHTIYGAAEVDWLVDAADSFLEANKACHKLYKTLDRLTVGAPAPTPTHARQCGYWLDLNCSCGIEGDTP